MRSALDPGDLDLGELLAVAVPALRVLAAAVLEDDHLLRLELRLDHLALDRGAGHERLADLRLVVLRGEEADFLEGQRRAGLDVALLDADSLPELNVVLVAAVLDDRVHGESRRAGMITGARGGSNASIRDGENPG